MLTIQGQPRIRSVTVSITPDPLQPWHEASAPEQWQSFRPGVDITAA